MSEDESAVMAVFRAETRAAYFATELCVRLGMVAAQFENELTRLRGNELVVIPHSSPDSHVDADLRIVALTGAEGEQAATRVWSEWLRDFLAAHRCG